MTRATFIVRTRYGAPIIGAEFTSRKRADMWISLECERWPGWFLELVDNSSGRTVRAILAADEMERAA